MFTLKNVHRVAPKRFPVSHPATAAFGVRTVGPWFGSADMQIEDKANKHERSRSAFPGDDWDIHSYGEDEYEKTCHTKHLLAALLTDD